MKFINTIVLWGFLQICLITNTDCRISKGINDSIASPIDTSIHIQYTKLARGSYHIRTGWTLFGLGTTELLLGSLFVAPLYHPTGSGDMRTNIGLALAGIILLVTGSAVYITGIAFVIVGINEKNYEKEYYNRKKQLSINFPSIILRF